MVTDVEEPEPAGLPVSAGTACSAAIRSIAPWFGGKRTLASEIVKELGEHRSYWEPFCGSLAVLFSKPPSSGETVNDLHGPLTTLAKVLASDACPDLYERLMRTTFCETLFREVRQRMADGSATSDIDVAYCFFVESWMGRNGVAGTRTSNTAFCVRFTSNGGDPSVRFRSAVDSIPAWHQRLRGVSILQRDAFELLERVEDKSGTVIYCDPPYVTKGARYVHDFKPEDHARLAVLLRRFKETRVVVSYYDDEHLAEWYPGWTKRALKATKAMVNQGMRDKNGRTDAPEVLLMNGPSLVQGRGLF
jgi:DNA adenine methylase